MREETWSKDQTDGMSPPNVIKSSYPTIFFFDLDLNRTKWEIFGAEQFIDIDKQRRVSVLTNEIWTEENTNMERNFGVIGDGGDDEILNDDKEENLQSRHEKHDNYVWKVKFGTSVDPDKLRENKDGRALPVNTVNSYKLTFGLNKDLTITEHVKFVEAFSHNKGQRVTLLYKGLGSFTFQMKKAKSIAHKSHWFAKIDDYEFSTSLKFKYHVNKKYGQQGTVCVATGGGKDENDKPVQVKIEMEDYTSKPWTGYYEKEDEMCDIFIADITFNSSENRFSTEYEANDEDPIIADGLVGKLLSEVHKNARGSTKKFNEFVSAGWREVEFRLIERDSFSVKYFSGQIDPMRTHMKGYWTYDRGGEPSGNQAFEFFIGGDIEGGKRLNIKADIKLKVSDHPEQTYKAEIDFKTMNIMRQSGMTDSSIEMYSKDCVDMGELCFFILQPDVGAIRTQDGFKVQAKLRSIGEEDDNSNGQGVVRSSVLHYNVSEEI